MSNAERYRSRSPCVRIRWTSSEKLTALTAATSPKSVTQLTGVLLLLLLLLLLRDFSAPVGRLSQAFGSCYATSNHLLLEGAAANAANVLGVLGVLQTLLASVCTNAKTATKMLVPL
uniref:Uncharacterized protein n=1 Tax=Anopheles farauti TaxID=69004 RepID=A0A182QI91_9DIPT